MKVILGNIEQAVEVHSKIPEFSKPAEVNYFKERYQNKKHIIFIALKEKKPIGYMISYDRYSDGSIYCWMAGVLPNFRKLKALSAMMNALEKWSKENNYKAIKIKTSNKRKAMLSYLINNDFLVTKVYNETQEKLILNNRINLEKHLI
ncbi:MAG: GNAT family N-acetyltransferase [Chitinophagales bacterium]